ncbi:MAG TPA: hypothetical protein VMW31_00285, partial [Devosiaceae bacterium]|nr:hypothetical protein [Devosiaceae bacterium]
FVQFLKPHLKPVQPVAYVVNGSPGFALFRQYVVHQAQNVPLVIAKFPAPGRINLPVAHNLRLLM